MRPHSRSTASAVEDDVCLIVMLPPPAHVVPWGVGAVKECAPVDNPQSTKTRRFRPNSYGMANGTLCRPLFEPQKATLYAMAALRNGGRSVREEV